MSLIHFDPSTHTYTNTVTNDTYTSVTTLIGAYAPKFDTEKWAAHVAQRDGVSVEFVKEQWALTAKQGTDRGSIIHDKMERFVKEQPIEKVRAFAEQKFAVTQVKKFIAEEIVYSVNYKVAGMADLICIHSDDTFSIVDYKTNKKISLDSKYNEYMFAPIEYLQVSDHTKYALQLSTYAFLYQQLTGLNVRRICFYHIKDGSVTPYYCNYLKPAVIAMLEDHKSKAEE